MTDDVCQAMVLIALFASFCFWLPGAAAGQSAERMTRNSKAPKPGYHRPPND